MFTGAPKPENPTFVLKLIDIAGVVEVAGTFSRMSKVSWITRLLESIQTSIGIFEEPNIDSILLIETPAQEVKLVCFSIV